MAEKDYIVELKAEINRLNAELGKAKEQFRDLEGSRKAMLYMLEDLNESAEGLKKLSRAVECIPASVIVTDLKGNIEYVNKKFTELSGYTTEEAIGQNPRILKSGKTPPEVYKQLWENITAGKEWRGEFINKKKNGEIFYEFASISSVKNAEGAIIYFIAVKEDITERKRIEEALLEHSRIFEAFFENAITSIAFLDKKFNFIRVNKAYAKACQRDISEFPGHNHFEFYPSDAKAIFERVVETKAPFRTISRPFIFPDHTEWGVTYWDWVLTPILDNEGEVEYLVFSLYDVTERQRASDAIMGYAEQYQTMLSSKLFGFWLVDEKGKLLDVNDSYCRMSGYTREELLNLSISDLEIIEIPEETARHIRKVIETGTDRFESKHKAKDGRVFDVEISVSFWYSQRKFVVFISDITEHRKLEAQLRQSQKMEAIGTLAGGIAHDFNNILTAIIGYASVTHMKMPEDDPLRHNLEQILISSERAAVLTQSLLAFSRKQISNPETVKLDEIVINMEKLLSRVIREDIELKVILSDNSLTVKADAGQIEQVLMNLATNARDAMPEGGTLAIQTEPFELDSEFIKAHGYGKAGTYACIIVSDTGIGMDEATKGKIFEPFFTTKEVGKGTGLGLSMVYGIIKQHNGYINCYSELGKGTSFKIYLPLFESMPVSKTVTEVAAVAEPTGGTETILVAEDEESVRRLIKEVLEEYGYKVIEAADGEEAVNKFMENKDKIDLLLFDIIMPKMSGREAYERIKRIKPDIKLLMSSGYPADFISKGGILEEGLNFIAKPMPPIKLLKKVREVLDKQIVYAYNISA